MKSHTKDKSCISCTEGARKVQPPNQRWPQQTQMAIRHMTPGFVHYPVHKVALVSLTNATLNSAAASHMHFHA